MKRLPARRLSPEAIRVRHRIDEWRQTRLKRTAMPEVLWEAAVELAREHGAWATASALGVRYDTLSFRLKQAGGTTLPAQMAFVEVPAPPRARSAAQATVIEVSRADGTRLTVRLDERVEIGSLIDVFCRVR